MQLQIYSTTKPFANKQGEQLQGYFVVKVYEGNIQNICVYGPAGKNIGDFVDVKYSRNKEKYFIANEKQNEHN